MIIHTVNISFKAQIEISQGWLWLWYEREQPGLGIRFEQEVYKKLNLYGIIRGYTPIKTSTRKL